MLHPLPTSLSSRVVLGLMALGMTGCRGCQSDTNLIDQDPEDSAPPAFTNDFGQWLSMAAMPDGSPAITYYDATAGAVGFAIASIGDDGTVTWAREEVDGYINEDGLDSGDRGKYTSLAIAADGTAWVTYQDVGLGTLRYAQRDPQTGVWTSNVADIGGGSSSDAGYFSSLALDGSGSPVVVHYDKKQGNLRIARWIGASFTGEVLATGEPYDPGDGTEIIDPNVGEFAQIVISGGIEYVAYYDRAWGDLRLSWGTPGAHTIETIDSTGDVGQWPDLAIADGSIYVSYHDVTSQDLRLAVGEPGRWTVETVDDGPYVGADTALFFEGGAPSVAYFDGRNNDMKLAWQSGGAWNLDTVAGSEGALGFHNEVIVTSQGTFAACYDYTNRTLWFSAID